VLREWGRIGCIGFGGPPAHIRLLRQLCVERKGWLDAREFEDAIAVCNLVPGPASTQLAIFCAWRLRGRPGALIGGAGFILPGLVVILALSVLFVATSPPLWVLGAGAGAGAAVPAVAVQAGWSLLEPSWRNRRAAVRWLAYFAAGLAAAATIGEWLVLVLLGCGAAELLARSRAARASGEETGESRTRSAYPDGSGGPAGHQPALRSRLVLQVHDEVILEVPPDEEEAAALAVTEAMTGAAELRVPLTINLSWGATWADAKG